MLEYREFAAAEESPLQCVWELRGHAREQQRIAPDGRFELIVHLRDPFDALGEDGWKRQCATLVAGQMTRPLLVRSTGETHTVGVRLKSWASACITGLPANELTNHVLPGPEVNQALSHKLWNAVAGNELELSQIAQRVMAEFGSREGPDERVAAAVRQIDFSTGQCQLDDLTEVAGLSPRQLQRLFHRHVGVAPKTLIRIRRFSHVFRQLETSQASWAQIAYECGYTDQSHLIRDFAQFAGAPPAVLFSEPSDFAMCFTGAGAE